MVSLFSDKSDWIVGTPIRVNKNFASESDPNITLFRGNDPELLLVMKNTFQKCIIYLYLKSFAKNHIFRNKLWKVLV